MEGGEGRGTRQERSRDQYDVRRKERGERTQKWKEPARKERQAVYVPNDSAGQAHLTTLALDSRPSAVIT